MSDLIFKAEREDQQIVYGEVYVPMVPDSDGEFMDEAGIATMAWSFLESGKLKNIDLHHNNKVIKACVVESFIAREGDDTFIPGSWVVGVHVDDKAVWSAIKKGELNGFSMESWVKKVQYDVEMEFPPIITGKTYKSESLEEDEDHDHTFYVAYDSNGKFIGGNTDTVDGHFHKIMKGTTTEVANNHKHKFSHVDFLPKLKEITKK